jgi:protein TonB
MAEEKSTTYRDMLDIIFTDRNKAYGAFQLRREYPKRLGRALLFGLGLIILFFLFPYIMQVVGSLAPKEKPFDVEAKLGPPPDIDPNNPPPPPPPPPPTPPPPVRSTVKFVPPVVKKDEEVQQEKPPAQDELKDKKEDIGKETKKGNDEAAPSINDHASELVVEAPPPPPEKTYEMFDIQKPPSFPGGDQELMKFLAKNIEYPALAKENNIQGVVALTFVVGKDGSVNDVQIIKDIGGGCGKEAVRVVKSMPKWNAGEANGNPVKVRFTLPVRFKLD